jgi:hypothetical protein
MSIGVSGAEEIFAEVLQGMQQAPMMPPQVGGPMPGGQAQGGDPMASMNQEAAAMGQGAMAAAMV